MYVVFRENEMYYPRDQSSNGDQQSVEDEKPLFEVDSSKIPFGNSKETLIKAWSLNFKLILKQWPIIGWPKIEQKEDHTTF